MDQLPTCVKLSDLDDTMELLDLLLDGRWPGVNSLDTGRRRFVVIIKNDSLFADLYGLTVHGQQVAELVGMK